MKIKLSKMLRHDAAARQGGYRDFNEMLEARLDFLTGREKIIMTMRVRQGAAFGQIAKLTGLHEATVARMVRKITAQLLKGTFAHCLRNSKHLTSLQLAIARDHFLAGLPLRSIARKNNCTLYHVRAVLAQLGDGLKSAQPRVAQPPSAVAFVSMEKTA
jgi:hypothetical protein